MKEPTGRDDKSKRTTSNPLRSSPTGGVKSVEVAGRILQALVTHAGPRALNEVSRLAGMPASKAHRYLASLVKIGLVEQSLKDRRYGLGRFAIELGAVASRLSDPLSDGIELTHRLRERVDETLTLSIWSSSGPLVLHVEESSRPIVMTMRRGTILPLLNTATGIVFCSAMPRGQTNALIEGAFGKSGHPRPIVGSRDELDLMLASVRKQGYAINSGHLLPDIIAIAAPIYDRSRSLTGVLAVLGRESRIDPSCDPSVLDALLEVTRSSLPGPE